MTLCNVIIGLNDADEHEGLVRILKATMALIPDGLVIHGPEGEITYINPAARVMLGYSDEQLREPVRKRIAGIQAFDINGRPVPYEQMPTPRVLRGEIVKDFVLSWPGPGGYRLLSTNAVPVLTRTGRLIGAVVNIRDVTEAERQKAERSALLSQLQKALEESEKRQREWQSLFESISDGIFVMDETGQTIAVNKAGLDLLGIESLDEVMQCVAMSRQLVETRYPDGRLMPPEEWPKTRVLRGETLVNYPFKVINRKGEVFDLLFSGGPVTPVAGSPKRFIQVVRDITEICRLEKAKDEFLLVISHELRNPLQVIKGLAQLMRLRVKGKDTANISANLDTLESQTEHVSHLVEDILTAYRLSAGRFTVNFKQVDMRDLLIDVVTGATISSPTHSFIVNIPKSPEKILVKGDYQRLSEIVRNLLSNAVKYSPNGTKVWVNVKVTEDHLRVDIEDEGVGIPPVDLERVFEGFYRGANPREWKSGGIGLGLFISRNLARLHGGDLWAENRSECGTRMCLKIPLCRAGC